MPVTIILSFLLMICIIIWLAVAESSVYKKYYFVLYLLIIAGIVYCVYKVEYGKLYKSQVAESRSYQVLGFNVSRRGDYSVDLKNTVNGTIIDKIDVDCASSDMIGKIYSIETIIYTDNNGDSYISLKYASPSLCRGL